MSTVPTLRRAPESVTEEHHSTSPELASVEQEARAIRSEFDGALQRHAIVDHLAGLSAHAIAQELIDRFGAERVLSAIARVRQKGKEYFFDLICELLPRRRERLAFYEEAIAGTTEGSGQKERYLRFCQECDAATHLTPILALPMLRTLFLHWKRKQLAKTDDGSFLAHYHFGSLPRDFDPAQYRDELAASGDRLDQLQSVEQQRFQETFERLSTQAASVRTRIEEAIRATPAESAATGNLPVNPLTADIERMAVASAQLQHPIARKEAEVLLVTLRKHLTHATKAPVDAITHKRTETYQRILLLLPAPLLQQSPDPQATSLHHPRSGNGGNGKPRRNGGNGNGNGGRPTAKPAR